MEFELRLRRAKFKCIEMGFEIEKDGILLGKEIN